MVLVLLTNILKSQCTPPATFAVGPYYIPCGPNSVVISAGTNSASSTYSYSWNSPPFAGMSCPAGMACYSNNVNGAGVYTVTIYDTTVPGCFSTNTMAVIQSTILSVSIGGNDTICSGASSFIWVSAFPSASSYTWSTGSNMSTINVSPTVTTIYTVTASNSSFGCVGSSSFTVTVNACLGVKELSDDANISIAPNPNSGKFSVNVSANIENGEIRLVNLIGQEVYRQSVKQGYNEINTGNLTKGVYYYNIYQNKEPVGKGKIIIE